MKTILVHCCVPKPVLTLLFQSARNLQVSGGREFSRAQMEHLENMPKEGEEEDDLQDEYDEDGEDAEQRH